MKAYNEEITYFETVMCFKLPLFNRTVRDIAIYLSHKGKPVSGLLFYL